jgi:hypothetical protein
MVRMIVRRGDLERYETLYKAFSARTLVVWDRRRVDRRRRNSEPPEVERRAAERRGAPPPSWTALGFVVAE